MSKSTKRIKNKLLAIFGRYTRNKASAEEQQFVDRFYDHIGKDQNVRSDLTNIGEQIRSGIYRGIAHDDSRRTISVMPYLRGAAAVLLVGAVSFAVWYHNHPNERVPSDFISFEDLGERPMMTIGNDKHYDLTDRLNQPLSYVEIDDQQVVILGDLEKQVADDSPRRINNPTKQVFTFLLDDGSQVWLNAYSYVEFPAGFGRTERIINTYGEVSFDVKKQVIDGRPVPFIVKTPLQTIQVLGTQFSVNAKEESEESVMLLEGKIKLTHNNYSSSVILSPGQKAHLNNENAKILVANTSDSHKVRAWRKGLFHFEEERIETVMEELSQWYGQKIEVAEALGAIPITGMVSRYENLEDVLQIIEITANVKSIKRGGKIYVTTNHKPK